MFTRHCIMLSLPLTWHQLVKLYRHVYNNTRNISINSKPQAVFTGIEQSFEQTQPCSAHAEAVKESENPPSVWAKACGSPVLKSQLSCGQIRGNSRRRASLLKALHTLPLLKEFFFRSHIDLENGCLA